MDRLASIGETSGGPRMAGFLLDLKDPLQPLGLVEDDSFDVFLTQEEIGDVLGLTAVHTNRILRALTVAGMLERAGRRFSLINLEALVQLAARPIRQPFLDQPWLPSSR